MKLQCSCGAKYSFDAKPEMLSNPVKFICPSCGLDASDFVNSLIREEFAGQAASAAPAPPTSPAPPAPPAPPAGRLRVSVAVPAAPATEAPAASKFCAKHHELATEHCAVCHQPICPKCMALFGFFCSPLCKGKAEARKIATPVYAGRKDLVEAKFWRKTGLIAGVLGVVVLLFFGAWFWYAWFGSVPHAFFSARFDDADRGYYGHAQLVGKDQLVALHGGTLARYDLKARKTAWSEELITKKEIDDGIKRASDADAKANEGFGMHSHRLPDEIERSVKQGLQSDLAMHVSGHNIWVAHGREMSQYDWDSGKVLRTVALPEREGEFIETGDELQLVGAMSVTHISLNTGEARVERLAPRGAKSFALAQNDAGGGLVGLAGNGDRPLDPKAVEAQAQNLKLQGRVALPALVGNAQHEKQLEQALKDDDSRPQRKNSKSLPGDAELFQIIPGPTGLAQFSYRLLEQRVVARSAMKAAPKKSALDGDINAAHTTEIVNEQLNEMQRNAGGDTVTEDQSRYQVTVRLPGDANAPDWTGEVVGHPRLFVLKTVNVVAAGKSVVVLDKTNKKLWQASLTYPVSGEEGSLFFHHEEPRYGDGPCVERGDTLYVFDQAVLTAFDLTSGNARWRLPSVGVVGLFFDNEGKLYVNTTTGNPDDIRYARQIDISRKTEAVVTKIDPATGKTLWVDKPGGYVSYVSGQFIYVIESYDPNPTDEDVMNDMTASLQLPAFMRIMRLRPSDGRILWVYQDARCPVDWNFDDNSIQLIFKREVQVLRYLTL